MSTLATELDHLKNHVTYPANKAAVVAACNGMADAPKEDSAWFAKNLPDGNYRNAEDVMRALLARV